MKKKILKSLLFSLAMFAFLTLSDFVQNHDFSIVECLENVYFSSLVFFTALTYIVIRLIRKHDWRIHDWVVFFFMLYPLAAMFYLLLVFLVGYMAFGQDEDLSIFGIASKPLGISIMMTVAFYFSYKKRQVKTGEGDRDAR